ncbi:putative dehydrogenase [Cladorrhinum sp. PSN332]|nr:putative dehydrogenase [Cladorrhinum sp. PSN332]
MGTHQGFSTRALSLQARFDAKQGCWVLINTTNFPLAGKNNAHWFLLTTAPKTAMPPQETSDSSWSVVEKIRQSPPVDVTKPYDTTTLSGKSILITGGASGFGAAFARHWAAHGSHIFIGDLNDAAGEELIAELRAISPSSSSSTIHAYFHCDVTSWNDQVSLFKSAIAASPTGGIDCVVAGAGIVDVENGFDSPRKRDDEDGPVEPKLKVIDVNFKGVMYTTHLGLYYLPRNGAAAAAAGDDNDLVETKKKKKARDRHILLVSSVAGIMPLPSQTEYSASKHAVMGMFRTLRGTSWLKGIRVNVINPYFVETPLLTFGGRVLLAGAPKGEVEDVVDAATRLVADEEIVGRALMIGPKMKVAFDGEDGTPVLDLDQQEGSETRAVWEIYGHDYEQVETFVWRYLTMLNAAKSVYGWKKTAREWWAIFTGGSGQQQKKKKEH